MREGLFYGWYIVGAAFLGNIAYAEQFNASFGVFLHHVAADTGWGRTALAGIKSFARLTEAGVTPFIGPLVDRYGARWIMVGGGLVGGLALIAVPTVDAFWQLLILVGVLAPIGGVCLGGFVSTVAVANWFVVRRGRAMGIASMGTSFGTTLLPLVVSGLIALWGWRGAWMALGVSTLFLTIPAAIFVRRRPEDLGLHPDGIAPYSDASPDPNALRERRRQAALAADVVWTRTAVLRTPVLWVMVFAWGLSQFAMASTTLHMVPFLQDLGYPLVVAAAAVSLRSGIGLVASPAWGLFMERIPAQPAAAAQFLLVAAGVAMWLFPPTTPTLVAGILLFGIGGAGSHIAAEMIWASFYGRVSLGTVRGIAYPLQSIFAASGPFALGLAYDLSGSYQSSFVFLVAGCLVSAVLVRFVRPPRSPSGASV